MLSIIKMTTPVLDVDGMPLAPQSVANDTWSVFGVAMNQCSSFHSPTQAEKDLTMQLLTNFKTSTINGISAETTKNIMDAASKLGLYVCRVKTVKNNVPDSYLLLYTKPGIHNYSGAFMMLRETKHSKVIILSPHDDSDGTYADTKIGMANSYALALFSNGHKRGRVSSNHAQYRASDIVHSMDNLGTYAVTQFCKLFPSSVFLHIHGMANNQKCMVNCRNSAMLTTFKDTLVKNTRMKPNYFVGLPVYFTVDKLVNTTNYLKTEMPAAIHTSNMSIMQNIVTEMEKNTWCWQSLSVDAAMSNTIIPIPEEVDNGEDDDLGQ